MLAMIPVRDGMTLPNDFLKGLMSQTVPIDIMVVSRPREDIIEGQDHGWKSRSVVKNMMKNFALETKDKYFVFLNQNVYIKEPDLFEKMEKFLEENSEYGAVAYDYKEHIKKGYKIHHIDIACMMITRKVLENLIFHNKGYRCDCHSVRKKLKEMNLLIRYLET